MTVLLAWGGFDDRPVPRDSLSAYYYSGMREWFVISIATTGFFLVAYKITEKNLDNTASIVGGACAILVAFFPTARSSASIPLTPLQKAIGEGAVHDVHVGVSTGFILSLILISVLFGRREGARPAHGNRRSGRFWHFFHLGCAIAMGIAGLWIILTVLTHAVHGPYWSLFAGETACVVSFGASWFAKGYEISYVLGRART
jgi:hypothetical protein